MNSAITHSLFPFCGVGGTFWDKEKRNLNEVAAADVQRRMWLATPVAPLIYTQADIEQLTNIANRNLGKRCRSFTTSDFVER